MVQIVIKDSPRFDTDIINHNTNKSTKELGAHTKLDGVAQPVADPIPMQFRHYANSAQSTKIMVTLNQ